MKTLDTLIRLHKRTLDELRRSMGALELQKGQLQQAIITLQEELNTEVSLAGKQLEMATFFGGFAKRIKKRQEDIQQEIRAVDKKIIELNKEIFEAFTELKKYEIAKENAKIRAQEEEKRKETLMLDEIASQQYQIKQTKEGG
ncbi:MAG: flagellar FliJ family protein [Rickettsiales bacterium]|jgi:flagellar export protein FliJ